MATIGTSETFLWFQLPSKLNGLIRLQALILLLPLLSYFFFFSFFAKVAVSRSNDEWKPNNVAIGGGGDNVINCVQLV